MAHRVHALVQAMHPAEPQTLIDKTPPKPPLEKLPSTHDPVLLASQLGNRPIHSARTAFAPYFVVNAVLGVHPPKVGLSRRTFGARFVPMASTTEAKKQAPARRCRL